VARYITRKQAEGLAGWTVRGHVNVLSGVFAYASRHLGFARRNPATLLDRVERPSTDDQREHRILTPAELVRLLAATSDTYRLLVELIAETGLRQSEALGLAWQNVDTKEATLTLTHQLARNGERVPLKTKRSRRSLEITGGMEAKLRDHKMAAQSSGEHDLVFTTRLGRPLSQRNALRGFTRAAKAVGLEDVERDGQVVECAPTMHDLRHSHASALIAAGWDMAEVSARLGHASVATTLNVYVHCFDTARRSDDRRSRLAALYGPAVVADVEAGESSSTRFNGVLPSTTLAVCG
jgi:integrase